MRHSATAFGLIVLVCTVVAGCEVIGAGEEESGANSRSGPYAFTAYDSTGGALIQGTLNLGYPQDLGWDIEGTWEFGEVQDVDGWIERMVGRGQLHGSTQEDGNVRISLMPGVEDADAVLSGEFKEGNVFQGEWAIVDWGMTSRSGRFVASPQ